MGWIICMIGVALVFANVVISELSNGRYNMKGLDKAGIVLIFIGFLLGMLGTLGTIFLIEQKIMKIVIKIYVIMLTCLSISACEFTSTPKITMNPIDDAKTCIKLYEKNAAKGEKYMQDVITTYYMQNKNSDCDKFTTIVTEKIAEMSFR